MVCVVNIISLEDRAKMAKRHKGEVRTVSIRSPVMGQLLRSIGKDPVEFWHDHGIAAVNMGLKDIEERGGGRAFVRELLLQKLEEYKS